MLIALTLPDGIVVHLGVNLPQKIIDEILLLVGQCELLEFVAETQEEGLPFF